PQQMTALIAERYGLRQSPDSNRGAAATAVRRRDTETPADAGRAGGSYGCGSRRSGYSHLSASMHVASSIPANVDARSLRDAGRPSRCTAGEPADEELHRIRIRAKRCRPAVKHW